MDQSQLDPGKTWEPHGKVKVLDSQHFAIVVKWGKRIVSQIYRHETLDPNPKVGSPAFRLTKADGKTYDLIRREFGWACECPRYERHGRCKHLRAALAVGLLGAKP